MRLESSDCDGEVDSTERILRAAQRTYDDNPVLPLAVASVAEGAGVSRSLVYARFPRPCDLPNALLSRHAAMVGARLAPVAAMSGASCAERGRAAVAALIDHYVEEGLLLAQAPSDAFLTRSLAPDVASFLRGLLRAASRQVAREYDLPGHLAIATVLRLAVVAEQAARLVRRGRADSASAKATADRIVTLTLESLRPTAITTGR